MFCSSSSSNLAQQQQRSRPRPLVAPAFFPVDQSLATTAFSYTPGLCSNSSTISSSRHGDELHGFGDKPPAAKTTTAACVRDTSCCCCGYMRPIFKASQETQIKLKTETVRRQVLESKSSSVTASTQIPRVCSPSLLRRTHARLPHFHRTRERARRRRPDRGKRDARLRSRSSAAGSPFERTGYHTNSPHLGNALPTYPTPRGETYCLPAYQPTNLLYFLLHFLVFLFLDALQKK